ncbi:glycosyltransferase family 4 protein [Pelomonas aquatica]|jgi:glycosyltransferase involved in cell wall biosynthesis|uniref:Glycosyltransferase family 1 protein n=2 Tax=Pseudomonadota TaxID=1224 RepID=A0A9X4R6P6_9BURK|nr:glycosyltransferase family 1 protein [Pelomonas aquatica]MCY4757273.1 glycosyltransferase family 1 protein [Pelomonas aquatica]MDG0865020.1 glycosyltransferase family 1 protein [Pelomonas aquatica]
MNTQQDADDILVDDLPAPRHSRRLAVVTETYPPEVNGVAMSMARVVDGLNRRNHDVQLIRPRQPARMAAQTGTGKPDVDEVLTKGLPVPLYPNLRMGVPSKRALVKLWSLRRPDVVHIATEGPLGWSALQAAQHLSLPVTSDYRTNFHAYGKHYRLGLLSKPIMGYLRKFHNRCDATMVPTEAMRVLLAERGFERLTVVGRGVDAQRFDPARRNDAMRAGWGAGPDDLVMGYVGRLAPEKNLGAVLAAYEAVKAVQPRARLVFVGDGPMRAELAARAPDAVFAGQRSGDDLAAHYAGLDLFLFASLTETFGNVTTEAMASGCAVVAFESAAAGELIRSGTNGWLAGPGKEPDFVAAVRIAALDAAARRAVADAARATARRLDWADITARFEAVLEGAIARAEPAFALPGLQPAA